MKFSLTGAILCFAAFSTAAAADRPIYRDPAQPVEARVEDLLSRMTLAEKVGQLNMPCVYVDELGRNIPAKTEGVQKFAAGTYTTEIGPGGGFFTLANEILRDGSRQQAEFFNKLQKIAIEQTRLGIPLLETEEGTHGVMCSGKTIYPEGPGLGSTWNPELIRKIYASEAREARAVGIHQLFTLVVEPNRDPRLGRNQEGYSEDPYLCSRFARSIVRGAQGAGLSSDEAVVAGLCHYPGQSQPVSGFERGAMEISERMLREIFLPPWVAGIRDSGARGVMATYPEIDSVPTHGSAKILTGILRQELGFEGLVLGEGSGLSTLVYEHLAKDQKQAGQIAIRAGVDVGISYEPAYMGPLIESVAEGKVSMEDIDRSVRRVLRQKFVLGLFDHPYVDVERAAAVTHTTPHQELSLQAARESIVLLKNEGVLPLKKDLGAIAVIGPNADDTLNQLGDYAPKSVLQPVITTLAGIRRAVSPRTKVLYARGCGIMDPDTSGFAEAVKAAKDADVAIVVVGETGRSDKNQATDGEGFDVASLDLTGVQEDLVKAVYATGKPTVVVLINGRALSVRWIADKVPALVEAWLPGERGGDAVAEILFGDYNPSGRLPVTIPRSVGQLPAYYNYKPSKEYWIKDGWGRRYVDMPAGPLYDFGYGLSYTKFEYTNLRINPKITGPQGEVRVSLDVSNSGARAGEEVVQLYLRDEIATVSRPVKELRGFEKVALRPGESKSVQFTLNRHDLIILDRNLDETVEPGVFQVMVGHSSGDIRQTGEFELK
ncbi:MAG: glycoside hydrolase family 3 C-terminal domain-containing protein [Bryobacteraceae bacterium]